MYLLELDLLTDGSCEPIASGSTFPYLMTEEVLEFTPSGSSVGLGASRSATEFRSEQLSIAKAVSCLKFWQACFMGYTMHVPK